MNATEAYFSPSPLVWRKIVKREYYTAHHARHLSGLTLTLNCGHTPRYKASQAPKRSKVRCKECESLKKHKLGTIWTTRMVQEVWDEVMGMPKLVPWKEEA
jgi:hypothetical protein